MNSEDLRAINERLSLTLQSGSHLAFDWIIAEDRLQFTSGIPRNFQHASLQAVKSTTMLVECLHPKDRPSLHRETVRMLRQTESAHSTIEHLEMRLKDAAIGWRWVDLSGTIVERDANGRAIRVVGMFTDISARKLAEQRAAKLRNLYAALRRTIHAILHMESPERLYGDICRIAVEHGKFPIATIRLLDPDSRMLRMVAGYGKNLSFFETIEASTDPEREIGNGPSGIAIRENRPVIANDFFDATRPSAWQEVARKLSLNSLASFPFCREGKPAGVLVLYSTEIAFFDQALIDLLNEMTQEISFALDNFAHEIQRVSAELALAESEKFKNSIFLASLDCIVSFDTSGGIVDFNPAAERTFGHRRDDVTGSRLADLLIAPESRGQFLHNMTQFLETGDSPIVNRRMELTAIHASGMAFPIEIAIAPIYLRDKQVFTAYMRDISELKQSQALLRDSEARYRQMIHLSPEAILVHLKGKFVLVNEACVKLFGATHADQLLGKDVVSFMHPDYRELGKTRARQLPMGAVAEARFLDEIWIRTDGTAFHAEVAATKFIYLDKPAIQIVLRDITARKLAESLQLAQNRILGMIASGAALNDTLLTLGQFIEAQSKQGLCAIRILNAEGSMLRTSVAPSLPHHYIDAVDGMPASSHTGTFWAAVARRKPVTTADIATDKLWAQARDLALKHKLHACSSWPIFGRNNKVLGVLSVYYHSTGTPNATDLQLLEISANLAGIAIENKESEDKIRHLAHYDEMTSLPNRSLFNQLLSQAMKAAQRHKKKLAVLFVDLDRFKNINDTLGHDAGDMALKEFARRMRSCLRDTDTLSRMGGDEFYILIEDLANGQYAETVAKKIMDQASIPFFINSQECHLTASIGIAIYPEDGVDAQDLLKNADIAMYRAKNDGKNTYRFYSPSKNIHTIERLAMESQLRRAIENDEFTLHYQPKVELASGRITGVEALVRWRHPEKGLLAPHHFIPMAEETRLIIPISKRILYTACRDALKINANAPHPVKVAVNLSAQQLDDPGFLRSIHTLLAETGIPPHLLQLEITESMVMHNPEQAVHIMNELLAMGIRLDIDDFGTGYSSLAYLKRFPVFSLKIDRSFIQDIPTGPNDTAITQAIIAMGHSIGLRIIAEGVETAEQMEVLQQFGCDEFQGYYFSRPIPLDEFLALQKRHAAQTFSVMA